MFKKENLTVPNFLSVSRALFLPILVIFAVNDMELAFLIGYIILGSTDFFDGMIARKFNQKTEIGKALDSIADLFFYIASAYFLATLYKSYIEPNYTLLIVFFSILFLSFVISAILLKKPIMMHTSILRFNAVLVYFVVICSYFMDTTYFITGILILYIIGFIEEIAIFIKYGEVDPDTKSFFRIDEKI